MAAPIYSLFLILGLFSTGHCGDLKIDFSPSSLKFNSAASLRLSDFDDVIASSLGYTSQGTGWRGLGVKNPFKYPQAAVVIGIHNSEEKPLLSQPTKYPLKEDATFDEVYLQVTEVVAHRSYKQTYFNLIKLDNGMNVSLATLHEVKYLNNDVEPDSTFLHEMALLPSIVDHIKDKSTAVHGGQDIVFIEIDSFAPVVKTYGKSKQADEAEVILSNQLSSLEKEIRQLYDDQVVIYSVSLNNMKPLRRSTRAAVDVPAGSDLNLAVEYGEDYPAMFNIILILSIVLIVATAAAAASMAYMDPGRDSIIYRMTNPKMKKDQ